MYKPIARNAEPSTPSGVTTQAGLLKMFNTCQKSRERSASERGGNGKKAKSHQFQTNGSLLRIRCETTKQAAKLAAQSRPITDQPQQFLPVTAKGGLGSQVSPHGTQHQR